MNATQAEEHLRVIRSLMEKATIYRAISAPTALVGGVLSLVVGGLLHWLSDRPGVPEAQAVQFFLGGWLGVLASTAVANTWFLWRDALRRGEDFISPGMRKALWALFPPLLSGAAFTAILGLDQFHSLPPIWMVFYGLGLLATTQFSPCAIPRLGWAFLLIGLAFLAVTSGVFGDKAAQALAAPNLLMIASFGGLHIIYAGCTWRRSPTDES